MRRHLFSLSLVTVLLAAGGPKASGADEVARLLILADSLVAQAEIDSALSVELAALSIAEREFGPTDTTVATVLMYIGAEQCGLGRFEEARSSWGRALGIRTEALGPEHPRTADCRMNLGLVNQRLEDFVQAEADLQAAHAAFVAAFGAEHARVARAAQNLFGLYRDMGRLDSAVVYAQEAVSISRIVHGVDHVITATNLANLGVVEIDLSRFDLARTYLEESVSILDAPDASPQIRLQLAMQLNNLGNVYAELRKQVDAVDAYQRSLIIREDILGPDHPDVAVTLGNLASACASAGMWTRADSLNRRALAILQTWYGSDHTALTHTLVNLASIAHRQGSIDEAYDYYQRALDIRSRAFGEIHPGVASICYSIATLDFSTGRLEDALALQRRSLAIRRELFGDNNPEVAESLEHLSLLYRATNQHRLALDAAVQAESIRRRHLLQMASVLSEREALSFSARHRASLGNLGVCYRDSDAATRASFAEAIVNALLSSKGLLTDQMTEVYRWLSSSGDIRSKEIASRLRRATDDLAALYVSGPSGELSAFTQVRDSLQRIVNDAEFQLVRASESYRTLASQISVSADDLGELLPADAALIEYVRLDFSPAAESAVPASFYFAVVVKHAAATHLIDLGTAVEIDSLSLSLHRHLEQVSRFGTARPEDKATYLALAQPLTEHILTPLLPLLAEARVIMIAPDGALNTVSFAALPLSSTRYVIEDHVVHYLSAGRDLIRFVDAGPPRAGMFALGDPDFNTAVIPKISPSSPDVAGSVLLSESRPVVLRQGLPDCGALRDLVVSPLPSTRDEVVRAAEMWREHSGGPVLLLTDTAATEEAFRGHVAGKHVLHLATHGFFVGDDCEREVAPYLGEEMFTRLPENPLVFSGLCLAGANARLLASAPVPSNQDGILTALEVTSLDLSGVRLAVLSACETGLGTGEQGEGLFGLKRAFHLAGVATVVSSLWTIPDEATADILGTLYERGEQSLPDFLRQLQIGKIRSQRQDDRSDHPFTWGAFTVQGEWRN